MYIERLQVEEGFLDGLDITFSPGLNTIIGARGTGKSSVLELIRFCLASKSYSKSTRQNSHDHALSVLGSGQVTVTLRDGDHQIVVTRTADYDAPQKTDPYDKPLIFSQSEVEKVGLSDAGRLRIIDGFISGNLNLKSLEEQSISSVQALTIKIASFKTGIDDLENRLSQAEEIQKQLKELEPKEKEVAGISADANKKSKELEKISKKLSSLAVDAERIALFEEEFSAVEVNIDEAIEVFPDHEYWEEELEDTPLGALIKKLGPVEEKLNKISSEIEGFRKDLDAISKTKNNEKNKLDSQARELRKAVEELQKGAGSIVSQGQKLRANLAQLAEVKKTLKKREAELEKLLEKRDEELNSLEDHRLLQFKEREKVEDRLNETLGPLIRVEVTQASQMDDYISVLTECLRGSGLQYKTLVPKIAETVSPRELLEITDNFDAENLADITGVNVERASKIISALNESNLGDIATAPVDDSASFSLLDGDDYKDFEDLSTGQRCTVILPIILEHTEKVIIIDQPEDHIDNAFITEALIKAILRRSDKAQMILTTHNANIPVLGNADQVIQMASDGSRGFEAVRGSLDDYKIIEAISSVMEGGAEAFKRRAKFYESLELV